MRCSPAAIAFSKSLGHVGDLRDSNGMFRTGSSSEEGDLGEWKVALFFSGRSIPAEPSSWDASCIDVGWKEVRVGVTLVL